MKQFYDTKARFHEATEANGAEYPMDYSAWLKLPDDLKAAALYVNFFSRITLAYSNAAKTAKHVMPEDAVTETTRTLMRNVILIKDMPGRYTGQYIYSIVYNVLISLVRIKRDQRAYQAVSNICVSTDSGKEYDLLDFQENLKDLRKPQDNIYSDEFWKDIESMDNLTLRYVDYLLNGGYFGSKLEKHENEIIEGLKIKLSKYLPEFLPEFQSDYCSFLEVCYNPEIESVTAIMRDGEQAVYCGEKIVCNNGGTVYIFMGASKDYYVPDSAVDRIRVIEIEKND